MSEEFLSLVILFIILGTPFSGAEECDFQYMSGTYLCDKIIHKFPSIHYGNFHLKCEECQIQQFTNNTFPYENLLRSFNVSDSGIQKLGHKSFSYFHNLQYLYLNHNDLRDIQPDTFDNLMKLFELHLEFNSLGTIKPHTFRGMSSSTVNVSHNLITGLTDGTFKYSSGLLSLDISHNKISNLETDCLEGLEDLEVLNLDDNNICYLPLGLFKWTKTLQHLNLANNRLESLGYGSLSGLRNLQFLSLAQNGFKAYKPGTLLSTRALIKLDISGNGLAMLDPQELIRDAPSLRTLYFEDNLFDCNQLKHIIRYVRTKNIDVENHILRLEELNIDGIACVEPIGFPVVGIKDMPLHKFFANSKKQALKLGKKCNQ